MRLCFLFGSGVSVPADYPTVNYITETVLCGNTPELTRPTVPPGNPSGEVVAFARWLKAMADTRYVCESERVANYEDIFFLASQIHEDYLGEFDNPALAPLMDKAIVEFVSGEDNQSDRGKDRIDRLAAGVLDHIRCSVTSTLIPGEKPRKMDHLEFIAEAIGAVGPANVYLLSVNHDCLLEQFLNTQKIAFTDGFKRKSNEVRIRKWEPCLFSDATTGIPLLKLHGGVNWFRFHPKGAKPWIEDYAGIREKCDPNIKDSQGRMHNPLDGPIFLIGTFNKMSSYTDPVFLELYYRAFRALQCADVLVTVGYGFGDKGINKLVADWVTRCSKHRLKVVDKQNACNLRQRARGAIRNKWDHLVKEGQLVMNQCDLKTEKVSWQDIVKHSHEIS